MRSELNLAHSKKWKAEAFVFIHENAFENAVCEIVAILSTEVNTWHWFYINMVLI